MLVGGGYCCGGGCVVGLMGLVEWSCVRRQQGVVVSSPRLRTYVMYGYVKPMTPANKPAAAFSPQGIGPLHSTPKPGRPTLPACLSVSFIK